MLQERARNEAGIAFGFFLDAKRFFFVFFFSTSTSTLFFSASLTSLLLFFQTLTSSPTPHSDAVDACKNLSPEDEAACMLALGCDSQAVHARLDAEEEEEANKKKAAELAAKK
jgi:hypothetical protein